MVIKVSSAADAVALVPHVFGFRPGESLVVLGVEPGVPTMRVDLPRTQDDLDECVDQLGAALSQHARGKAVFVMAFSQDEERAAWAAAAMATSAREVSRVVDALVVRDDDWASLEGGRGTVQQGHRDWVAAEMALAGRPVRVHQDRAALVASLRGDTEPVAAILRVATRVGGSDPVPDPWASLRVDQFLEDRMALSDKDVARLVSAIESGPVRDTLTARMTRETSHAFTDLWEDVVRRTPEGAVGTASSQLALASWLGGDGAKAWAAIDLGPTKPLNEIVGHLLTAAIPPSKWPELREAFSASADRPAATIRPVTPDFTPPPGPTPEPGPGLGL